MSFGFEGGTDDIKMSSLLIEHLTALASRKFRPDEAVTSDNEGEIGFNWFMISSAVRHAMSFTARVAGLPSLEERPNITVEQAAEFLKVLVEKREALPLGFNDGSLLVAVYCPS